MEMLERLWAHPNMETQLQEWRELGMVDDKFQKEHVWEHNLVDGKHLHPRYRYLPIDTKHFPDLELPIVALFDNLDDALDGWLIKSENYQALNTILPKFRGKVKCTYIDPPYNTKASEIAYINNYKHASWLSLLNNRIARLRELLTQDGVLCVTIDETEYHRLYGLLLYVFRDEDAILGTVVIRSNPSGRSTLKGFAIAHEYAIFVSSGKNATIGRFARTEKQIARYQESDAYGRFEWVNFRKHGGANAERTARPKLFYPIYVSDKDEIRIPKMEWDASSRKWLILEHPRQNEEVVYPISSRGEERTWKWGHETARKKIAEICAKRDQTGKISIYLKSRMREEGTLPLTWWDKREYSATDYGTNFIGKLFGKTTIFSFPKSVYATADCLKVANLSEYDLCLDFFAGSGTTAHAVINLNREDGGRRKYILVEMADYFNTVLLPRVKKVVFSDKWKDGRALPEGTGISHFVKYYELEQFEDALRRTHYSEDDLFTPPADEDPCQYLFLRDLKMLEALEVNLEQGTVQVDLSRLYENIDLPETLSNLTGKWIRRIDPAPNDSRVPAAVVFADGERVELRSLDWRRIKPLIWW
jgi:adenine-specific DNA-methyltransferase